MGKLEIEPFIHFSHQHPLKLLNFEAETSNSVTCSGCRLETSGWIYGCTTCNYFLHKPCSQMPQNFNHPIDPDHTLILLSSPIYREGAFKCNACGRLGKGFCYHCKECQLDLHILCAFMPSSVEHNAHHHNLNLCFEPPYHKKVFRCDVCKDFGSNCWLYRCSSCKFDLHTSCAMATRSEPHAETQQKEQHHHHQQLVKPPSVVIPPQFPKPVNDCSNWPQPQRQPMRIQSFPAQNPVSGNGLISNWNNRPFDQVNFYGGVPTSLVVPPQYVQPPPMTNRMDNDLMVSMIEAMMEGFAQQAGQAACQAILEGP